LSSCQNNTGEWVNSLSKGGFHLIERFFEAQRAAVNKEVMAGKVEN
jgi:hypothetical protein